MALPFPIDLGGIKASRAFVKTFQSYPESVVGGKTVLQIRFRLPRQEAKTWMSSFQREYEGKKAALEKEVRKALIGLGYHPDLLLDFSTPRGYRRYGYSLLGSYFSFFPAPNRPIYPIPSKIRPLKNAYLSTQWMITPGGVSSAVLSGIYAIEAILKDDKRKMNFK